jgi:transglutaminase-like putative cysteine protease
VIRVKTDGRALKTRRVREDRELRRPTDIAIAIFVSIGVMAALEPVFNFRTPTWMYIVLPDVLTAIIGLCTSRKHHAAIFFALVLYAAAGFFLFRENAAEWTLGFFEWWFDKLDKESVYWTQGNIFTVRLIVAFGVSCASYFVVRRIHSFFVLVFAVTAMFITIYALGYASPPVALFTLAIGAALALIQENHRRVFLSVRSMRANRELGLAVMGALLLVVCFAADKIVPQDVSGLRTDFFANLMAENVSADLNGRIGDPLRPSDNAVLYVAASDRILMKETAYAVYSPLVRTWRHSAYSTQSDERGYTVRAVDVHAQSVSGTAAVQYVGPATPTLFCAWTTRSIRFREGMSAVFSLADSGMIVSVGQLERGETYEFDYEIIDVNTLRQALEYNPELGKYDPDAASVSGIFNEYLEVPDEIHGAISGLVLSLTNDAVRDGATSGHLALKLYEHFADGYTYSLSPPVPPSREDLVDYLLNRTKTGYCAHFATALCMMAREAGIPSRYVTGFALTPSAENPPYNYVARVSTAHAWAELYIDGMGWVTFDPTSLVSSSPTYRPINDPAPTPQPTPRPTPSPSPPPTPVPTPKPGGSGGNTKTRLSPFVLAPIITVCAAAVLMAALLLLHKRRREKYTETRLRRDYPNPGDRLAAVNRRCQKTLRALRLSKERGETQLQFAIRASEELAAPNDSLAEICRLLMRREYGGVEPTDDEATQVIEAARWVEVVARERLSRVRWVFN